MLRLAIAAQALSLASAALKAHVGDPNDGFELVLFDQGTSALCLDGTRAGYYKRPGSGAGASTWIIELEGGGWCISDSDCASRSKTALGSSSSWPATGSPTMDGGSHGLFSNDCSVNKYFCNASMIHVNYADGASFAGHVDAAVNASGTMLYFRGRDILDTTIDYLLQREGMATAKAVILKGCSAGGLATILHADYVSKRLKAAIPGVAVVALPDAGYFLNHTDINGGPGYTPYYLNVASMQNVTVAGSVNDACLAAYAGSNPAWCFMAQYTAPFLTTPTFFAQDLDDSWQLSNIFHLGCSPSAGKPGDCNATQLAAMVQYRADTLAAMAAPLANPLHGGFITDCVQHCHTNIDFCYTQAIVGGQSMQDTFYAWYQNRVAGVPVPAGVSTLVVDGAYGTNPTCTPSCSPY